MQGELLYGSPWDRMVTLLALRQRRLRASQDEYEASGPGKARKRAYEARTGPRQGAEYHREYRARNRNRINARRRALRNSVTAPKVTV